MGSRSADDTTPGQIGGRRAVAPHRLGRVLTPGFAHDLRSYQRATSREPRTAKNRGPVCLQWDPSPNLFGKVLSLFYRYYRCLYHYKIGILKA